MIGQAGSRDTRRCRSSDDRAGTPPPARAGAPASMRSFSVSSERISSHAVCGSHIVPSVERMRRTGASISRVAASAAGDQVRMSADILGQRGDRDVGAVRERRAKIGPSMVLSTITGGRGRPPQHLEAGAPAMSTGRWSDWPASRDRSRRRGPARRACSTAVSSSAGSVPRPRSRPASRRTRAGANATRFPRRHRWAGSAATTSPGRMKAHRAGRDRRHARGEGEVASASSHTRGDPRGPRDWGC